MGPTRGLPAAVLRRAARDQSGPVESVGDCQRKMLCSELPLTTAIVTPCTAMMNQVLPRELGTRLRRLDLSASTAHDVTVRTRHILRSLLTHGWTPKTTRMRDYPPVERPSPRRRRHRPMPRPQATQGCETLASALQEVFRCPRYTPRIALIRRSAITGMQRTPMMSLMHHTRLPMSRTPFLLRTRHRSAMLCARAGQ
mmetsp:Transcript_12830/g.30733  ORF Transcript_12830/g.30733 Transcript_12830/m.30733 type:complete len:198 (-) Transcript_12830:328-921(-)